ncbi:hypothetical protein IFM89_034319 [Coptis chinensis]|uniref:Cationic amino acid transporter C-terminal domain-containing protein n=1 Tax=Coptis chinensis TaxID=261450 RepID=A0A835M2F5_9MAGN|nr:hypothetical protein IFM89_034319 [Coptis chinensis]
MPCVFVYISFARVSVCAVGGMLLLCGLFILYWVDQDDARHSFRHAGGFLCPFVPLLPIACILVNVYLMINLGIGIIKAASHTFQVHCNSCCPLSTPESSSGSYRDSSGLPPPAAYIHLLIIIPSSSSRRTTRCWWSKWEVQVTCIIVLEPQTNRFAQLQDHHHRTVQLQALDHLFPMILDGHKGIGGSIQLTLVKFLDLEVVISLVIVSVFGKAGKNVCSRSRGSIYMELCFNEDGDDNKARTTKASGNNNYKSYTPHRDFKHR